MIKWCQREFIIENPSYKCWTRVAEGRWNIIDMFIFLGPHNTDAIMSAMASEITSLTIVYSSIYSGADQRKHQSSASLAFVREFTGDHKWPVTRKKFPFDDVIMSGTFTNFVPLNVTHANRVDNRASCLLASSGDLCCVSAKITIFEFRPVICITK